MSYDLYFGEPKVSRDELLSYFSERPNYEIDDEIVGYRNKDTEVYFSFCFPNSKSEEEGGLEHFLSFHLNVFRPSYFGLEAEFEVAALVERFGFRVWTPNRDGRNEIIPIEQFLGSWNKHNKSSYRSFLSKAYYEELKRELGDDVCPPIAHPRPKAELEHIWRWNYQRSCLQEEIEEDIFIPKIQFISLNGSILSVITWPDAIPTLIPMVDRLLIWRKELATPPRSMENAELCIMSLNEVLPILKSYATDRYGLSAFQLPSPQTPQDVKQFVKSLTPTSDDWELVSMDEILDEELVKEYKDI